MKKLHSLILSTLVMLAGCGEINDRLDALEGRVDAIENTQIATISQQITSINNSILLLNNTDKELSEYITALEAEAENLQSQITATNTKIDEVKTEVLSTISTEKANILAELEALRNTTTTRLEEINATISELKAADGDMSAQIEALEAEAAQLEVTLVETNTKIDTVKSELSETISTEKANILAELEAFKATVNGELDAIKAVLETLKAKDAELDGKIATLQEYVDTELKATEDWATATFATLEQYNEVVATIATIEGAIEGLNESISALETRINEKIAKDIETACATLSASLQISIKVITEAYTSAITTAKKELTEAYTAALEGAISALETSMKEWVNEQLAGYYTIAEIDAKLQVMQTALENKITASENYLKDLISDLESVINEKIAENSELIATLSASLLSLEGTLADRAQDIIANTQAIEENAMNIKENAEKILANGENVQANTNLIAENKTLVAQNEQLIKSNQSAIAALQNGVSVNSQTIATNATNIATNASNIAVNSSFIANNASAIANNFAAIATNATNIAKLQSELEATANEITEAYTNAIITAIATNKGEIEAKLATEIQKVNDKINTLTQRVSALEQTVSNISTRLEDVESDIVDIQEQLTSLVNRIQSITYIPTYDDGKATIYYYNKRGTLDFQISPKSAIKDLEKVWQSALSFKAVHTQTRAVDFINLPITSFKADATNGTITIEVDGTNLGNIFFEGQNSASATLEISDGNNSINSPYLNLTTKKTEGDNIIIGEVSKLGVIGSFDASKWEVDIPLYTTSIDGLLVAKNIEFLAYDSFKIRTAGTWGGTTRIGRNYYAVNYIKANHYIAVENNDNSSEITVEAAGVYDIYLNQTDMVVYIMEAGADYTTAVEQTVNGEEPEVVEPEVTENVLYLVPNANWKADGARFAAYFYDAGECCWVGMTDSDKDGIYEVIIPVGGYTSVIFCRMNPGTTANNWHNKWGQTSDLIIPTDGTNLYTITEGSWDAGTWSMMKF